MGVNKIGKISQSTLGAADKCLLSAQYRLDTPDWFEHTAGAARAVGTGYHAGLELYYRDRLVSNDVLPQLDLMVIEGHRVFDLSMEVDLYDNTPIDRFVWADNVPDRETAHRMITAMLTRYVDGGFWWPLDWRVIGVEVHESFYEPTIGCELKVGADLVLVDPHDWLVQVDHKTAGKAWASGKHEPRKNDQAALYTYGARHLYPGYQGYRFVFDIIQYPKKDGTVVFERRISDPKPEHEAAVVKKAADFKFLYDTVHVELGRDLPANPASTLCNPKWCDFFEGCPHGRQLES